MDDAGPKMIEACDKELPQGDNAEEMSKSEPSVCCTNQSTVQIICASKNSSKHYPNVSSVSGL